MRRSGFTLIEMVAALAILLVVAALGMRSFSAGSRETTLTETLEPLRELVADAGFRAGAAGAAASVVCEPEKRRWIDERGDVWEMPPELKMERFRPKASVPGFRFRPGGATEGGAVEFSAPSGERARLTVSPLTGRVDVRQNFPAAAAAAKIRPLWETGGL